MPFYCGGAAGIGTTILAVELYGQVKCAYGIEISRTHSPIKGKSRGVPEGRRRGDRVGSRHHRLERSGNKAADGIAATGVDCRTARIYRDDHSLRIGGIGWIENAHASQKLRAALRAPGSISRSPEFFGRQQDVPGGIVNL